MNPPASQLEPAVRDPAKLRRTAWILVAIMIVGAILILKAYEKRAVETSDVTRPAMPYRIGIERDLRIFRQDQQIANLRDLMGKVFVVQTTSLNQTDADKLSSGVMERLAARYADNDDFVLVSLLVDPVPAEELGAVLRDLAGERGMEMPQWWLGGNEADTLHKFIKNELKSSIFPNEIDGRWDYDASVVLVDRDRRIRRAVVPQKQGGPPYVAAFDFEEAARWDARGVKTGTDLSNIGQLEALLVETIDTVLDESSQKP